MLFEYKNKKLKEQMKTIHKLTGKLNLYVSMCEKPQKERIKREFEAIRKLIDELILQI